MKNNRINTILIILAVIVWGAFFTCSAQEKELDSLGTATNPHILSDSDNDYPFLHYYEPTQKELEFQIVAPSLLLLELYFENFDKDTIGNTIYSKPTFSGFHAWAKEYFKEQLKD